MASDTRNTGAPTRASSIHRWHLLAAGLALAPAAAAASLPGSTELERHFAEWKSAISAINHAREALSDTASDALWQRVDTAEYTVVRAAAATPRVAAMRLWIYLEHITGTAAECDAIVREDIAAPMQHIELDDWPSLCAAQALRAVLGYSGGL